MEFQFNTDNTISGTQDVAARVEKQVRDKLARFEDRLTRMEVHVGDVNAAKTGGDDIHATIEVRPRGGAPLSAKGAADTVDAAARKAASKLATVLQRHFGKADRHVRQD